MSSSQLAFAKPIQKLILDIEGTICPISFVHDVLFPYFSSQVDPLLSKYSFPLKAGEDEIASTLASFPSETTGSASGLSAYIKDLVSRDVKDPVLKKLQGLVWLQGYETHELSCPIYQDVIDAIQKWHQEGKTIYIYSSGSVKAQKLLLKYNDSKIDLNRFVTDYFDTVNVGSKLESVSYDKIASTIGGGDSALFLSDNVLELEAAEGHVQTALVSRPGNAPADYARKVTTFDGLV